MAVTSDVTGNSVLSQGEFPLSVLRSQSSQSSGVDDSGTESGEDWRLLSPEVLAEVQGALSKLESALPGLDSNRRESLVQLVNRLQSCLNLQQQSNPPNPPPRRFHNRKLIRQSRHTVGVSREELADARRLLQETQTYANNRSNPELTISPDPNTDNSQSDLPKEHESLVSRVFRPVKFNPMSSRSVSEDNSRLAKSEEFIEELPVIERTFHKPVLYRAEVQYVTEPERLSASISYMIDKEAERIMGDASGSSILEYDPSLVLFTPEQSVQIAVHKAAINKQINEEEKRREDSDDEDGDISSTEDEPVIREIDDTSEEGVSSAQRLLQIATDSNKKNGVSNRFHNRNNKKLKMKRANTIDIPKPYNYYEADASSGDDYDRNSTDDGHLSDCKIGGRNRGFNERKTFSINFEPKTLNDMKFLAFLQQSNEKENKTVTYNPSARGGAPWSNRFSNIKTAFEPATQNQRRQSNPNLSSVKNFWQTGSQQDVRHARTPQPIQKKLPWTSDKADNNEGVVIGSLTVGKKTPGPINQFSHAAKSAFKPLEKKSPAPVQQQYNPPSVSGTVKQLAAQKFSGQNPSPKPILKHYPSQENLNSFRTSEDHQIETGFMPFKVNKDKVTFPQPPVISTQDSSHDFNKPYLIPPQKVTSNRVSDVVRSLELEKNSQSSDNYIKISIPQDHSHFHQQPIFKHHIDRVPDSEGHANLRIAPEMSEHIPYCKITSQQMPYVKADNVQLKQINYINNNSDSSPLQTKLVQSSPMQNQNLFIPPAHDTGYSSSIRSNSSVDVSPVSPGKVNNNYFPHNFSPQRHVSDSRTSSIENISAIIRNSSNESVHETPSPSIASPPEQFSDQYYGLPPPHHNFPTGRISKSSSIDENVDETVSGSPSPFWSGNDDRPSAFAPYLPLEAQTAVTRVMGRPQQAVTVTNKMRHRYENAAKKIESHVLSSIQQSSPTQSTEPPLTFPNVLQKSESWHQMVKEKMAQAKQAPPLPKISKAKSSHSLAFPKQFEAALPKETLLEKQSTIDQYLKKSPNTTSPSISKPSVTSPSISKPSVTSPSISKPNVTSSSILKSKEKKKTVSPPKATTLTLDDDLNNVDEAFESLFLETSKKRGSK